MNVVNFEEENLQENHLNDLTNFSKIFRKNWTYDNINNHQKAGFHPLPRKYIFGKTTGGGQINLPPDIFRVKMRN